MNRFFRLILIVLICISLYDIKIRFDQYITHASAFLNGLFIGFSSKDLSVINRFALHTCLHPIVDASLEEQKLYAVAFNMLVKNGHMLHQKKIAEKIGDAHPSNMDRKKIFQAVQYWKKLFDANPQVQDIFHQLKDTLVKASKQYPYFTNVGIHLYVDAGNKNGVLKNSIVKILDSVPWWHSQPNFCGMKYSLEKQMFRDFSLFGLTQEGGLSFLYFVKHIFENGLFHSSARWDIGWLTVEHKSIFNIMTVNIPLRPFLISITPGLWFSIAGMFLFGFLSIKTKKQEKKLDNSLSSSQTSQNLDTSKKSKQSSPSITLNKTEQTDKANKVHLEPGNDDDQKKLLFQTGG
ncbi:hypothetical protein MHK_010230 [Candidatus Magnetomorum sp. HK-1]|nr:hypothetical protein MHK_010230 [Candidatus Magnetomorum sp. HK-1]